MHPGTSITLSLLLCRYKERDGDETQVWLLFWAGGHPGTLGIPKSPIPPFLHTDPVTAWGKHEQPPVPRALAHCSHIPISAITTSTSLQHKEMNIKIQDAAVQLLPSLGLSCCCSIALPYQVLTDDSFCFPPLMAWCIWLPPHPCTVGEILALCKWIFNSGCHTSAAWDFHIPTSEG